MPLIAAKRNAANSFFMVSYTGRRSAKVYCVAPNFKKQKMKNITWADFAPFHPCYSPADRYGEWSGTMLELLEMEDIPAEDRIWAFCTGVAWDEEERDNKLRLFACACARKVWHLITDDRSKKAVEIAEEYAAGKASLQELAAAEAAARAAAEAAAWDAAEAAARAAQIEIAKTFL